MSDIPAERQEQLRQLAEEQRAWVAATGADRDPNLSPIARTQTTGDVRLTGAEVFFLATDAIATYNGIAPAEAERRVRDTATWAYVGALHLEGANLSLAHLEGANLFAAHLEGATLRGAHLERANLFAAHLEGCNLQRAHLEGADLRRAFFSPGTLLERAIFAGKLQSAASAASVADVRWQQVNLAIIQQWNAVKMLGDEYWARQLERKLWTNRGKLQMPFPKGATRAERRQARAERRRKILEAWQEAERANRQLSTVMRDQGMSDAADHFAYRGNICQRQLYRVQGRHLRRFGSWLLDLVSGYGYRPLHSVATYLLIVALFGLAYWALGVSTGHMLTWNEAGVVSLTAFHGRGFFSTDFTPGDPQAALAAVEAVIGLLIEITFIATFTQRFFAR
jgi:hypothetical protein